MFFDFDISIFFIWIKYIGIVNFKYNINFILILMIIDLMDIKVFNELVIEKVNF